MLGSFVDIGFHALDDPDPITRKTAIKLLHECDDHKLARKLVGLLKSDPTLEVKESAAEALGHFIYLGELENISQDDFHLAEKTLMMVVAGKEYHAIRQKALESLGYSSKEEVVDIISNAYKSGDIDWIASAITAMGHSANQYWEDILIRHLDDNDYNIQIQAIKAVGEIGISSATEKLIELLEFEDYHDIEIFSSIIWALSQIGGKSARTALEYLLENSDDEQEVFLLEQAIENLDFIDGLPTLSMFDFDDDEQNILGNLNLDFEVDD